MSAITSFSPPLDISTSLTVSPSLAFLLVYYVHIHSKTTNLVLGNLLADIKGQFHCYMKALGRTSQSFGHSLAAFSLRVYRVTLRQFMAKVVSESRLNRRLSTGHL